MSSISQKKHEQLRQEHGNSERLWRSCSPAESQRAHLITRLHDTTAVQVTETSKAFPAGLQKPHVPNAQLLLLLLIQDFQHHHCLSHYFLACYFRWCYYDNEWTTTPIRILSASAGAAARSTSCTSTTLTPAHNTTT